MSYILLDNNLSPKISRVLTGRFAGMHHVTDVGLEREGFIVKVGEKS
jgi:predicted nuclease of predicted toxin-antitoxin system